jgi:hypothetical protein
MSYKTFVGKTLRQKMIWRFTRRWIDNTYLNEYEINATLGWGKV